MIEPAASTTAPPPWLRPRKAKLPGVPAYGALTAGNPLEPFEIARMSEVTAEWAWGGADGSGVRVCVIDSGVDPEHPRVGGLELNASVVADPDAGVRIEVGDWTDLAGHGTACAGIIRSIAPAVSLSSVRVLTRGKNGSGDGLLAGLAWAIDQDFDVVNLSLATTVPALEPPLHALCDKAYFRRTMLVVSAHNMPVVSYPWAFSSVVSVASHDEPDPLLYYYNAAPPVEFFARGLRVPVAWAGGGSKVGTGNSFAAPHVAGICALILGKHPWLTPFQLKTVLHLSARNVEQMSGDRV